MLKDGGDITMENALNATNAMFLHQLKKPNIVDLPRGSVLPSDLPLNAISDNSKVRHIFDMVGPVELPIALLELVTQAGKDKRFHDLPAPFGLKASPGMQFDFQLAAVPLPDQPGKYFLLKHISFSEQVKIEFPKTLCHGDCLCVQWQGRNKNIRKALQ